MVLLFQEPYRPFNVVQRHKEPSHSARWKESEPQDSLYSNMNHVNHVTSPSYSLTQADKKEIGSALQSFEALGLDGQCINETTFPLPTIGSKLKEYTKELHENRDFFILSGLDTEDYTHEQNIMIFLGVSSYIGNIRGNQTDDGRLFAHVKNAREMRADQNQRPLRDSNRACAFHNDFYSDILAMQTHSSAFKGGDLLLASVTQVHEQMKTTRPDLAKLLFEPIWPHDLRRRFASSEIRPILFNHNNRLISSMLTDSLTGFPDIPRPADLPDLTDIQVEALALFQSFAHQNRVTLPLRKGDLIFINNFTVVHARDDFEDDAEHTRYMVRLWLKNEDLSWDLPAELKAGNDAVFHDAELEDVWNIYPEARTKFQVYERSTP